MNKSELVKGLKGVVSVLNSALDEQQRAANGQFGSGGGSSSKSKPGSGIAAGIAARKKAEAEGTAQKAKTGMHGGFAGAEPGKSREQRHKEAGQAASRAFAGGSSTAAKNAERLRAQMSQGKSTGMGGGGSEKVQTGTARLKSTLASNASRNAKN
jgi:hypothetical protein